MDLDANCSTLGANGALAEIVAKHVPEAYIGPAAHAVPPNLSQISGFLLFVAARSWARCLSVPFVSKILTTGPCSIHPSSHPFNHSTIHPLIHPSLHASMHALGYASPYVYSDLVYIMLWVAGGNCPYKCRCNRIRGERTRGKRFTAN